MIILNSKYMKRSMLSTDCLWVFLEQETMQQLLRNEQPVEKIYQVSDKNK